MGEGGGSEESFGDEGYRHFCWGGKWCIWWLFVGLLIGVCLLWIGLPLMLIASWDFIELFGKAFDCHASLRSLRLTRDAWKEFYGYLPRMREIGGYNTY